MAKHVVVCTSPCPFSSLCPRQNTSLKTGANAGGCGKVLDFAKQPPNGVLPSY
jgi:hypothetical protein